MRSLQVYHVVRKLHEDLEEGAVDGAGVCRLCVCVLVFGVWQVTMAHSNVMRHAVQARAKAAGEEYKMPPDDDATVDAIINLVTTALTYCPRPV